MNFLTYSVVRPNNYYRVGIIIRRHTFISGGWKFRVNVNSRRRASTKVDHDPFAELSKPPELVLPDGQKTPTGPYAQFIKYQVDDIVVSPDDRRTYRGLELNNGLKVILISDKITEKSAVSLDIAVGSMSDPVEIPGLAHFCEHMLFRGTEKYPAENGFKQFLTRHGGRSNATTSLDHTNYHYDVSSQFLSDSLDMFAEFFISPLFTESCTYREVLAVDSEYKNYLKQDHRRIYHLKRSLAKPNHDFNKFGTGNRISLLEETKNNYVDLRQELVNFYNNAYSANLMGLAVLGRESLDQLQEVVVPVMARIPNKNLVTPQWPEHPYGPEQLGYRLNVVPVKDIKSMQIFFSIPDLHKHYKSNPGHYVGHLLGHEDEGSLFLHLKSNGWVTAIVAGKHTPGRGFGFFTIDFDLTDEGMNHVNEILLAVFRYLKMLQDQGPQEWIHKELKEMKDIRFRFYELPAGLRAYVKSLAGRLHYYPIKEVLYGPYCMDEYKPELVTELLAALNHRNFSFTVISRMFKDKIDKKERWYGTEYSMEPIDPNLLSKFQEVVQQSSTTTLVDAQFRLPKPNQFIPTKFNLYPRDPQKSGVDDPELLHHDPLMRLWFKQDYKFLVPKCCLFLHFRNPMVQQNPKNVAAATLFTDLLYDSLAEFSYNAKLAGLHYTFKHVRYGFSMILSGFDEKLPILLEKLLERFASFKAEEENRFKVLKERYVRQLKNFDADQPYHHAMYYSNLLLLDHLWTRDEVLREAENLTMDQLNDFVKEFFQSFHVEIYVHGNSNQIEANKVMDKVNTTLSRFKKFKPLYTSQFRRMRNVQLPDNSNFIFEAENLTHPNSAVDVIFQTEVYQRGNMLNQLMVQILTEPFFDTIRTKEQLGYAVFCKNIYFHSMLTQGISFIIQGDKQPDFMDQRIEAFLVQIEKTLEEMTPEEFEKHKTALADNRLGRPKRLSAMAHKYWTEIATEFYHFHRDLNEVEILKMTTKEDLLEFFKNTIAAGGKNRKKLSIYVYSSAMKELSSGENSPPQQNSVESNENSGPKENEPLKPEKIDDIPKFKSHLPLFELPKPNLIVPQAGINEFKSDL